MHRSDTDLGEVPKSVRNGCQIVFAQSILDEIATPDTWAQPFKPDLQDGEVMTAYHTLGRTILDKYRPGDTFGPKPGHVITEAIQDDILIKDYRSMAGHFQDTFTVTPNQEAPDELLEYRRSGIRKEAPCDSGGCADECGRMKVRIDPIALMHYRWELCQLADYIIFKFKLDPPYGEPCLVWSSKKWKGWYEMTTEEYNENHTLFMTLNTHFPIRNMETQGPRFHQQFCCYIASAITQAELQHGNGQQQTRGVCFQIIDFLKALEKAEKRRAQTWKKEDPVIARQLRTCWMLQGIAIPGNEA